MNITGCDLIQNAALIVIINLYIITITGLSLIKKFQFWVLEMEALVFSSDVFINEV